MILKHLRKNWEMNLNMNNQFIIGNCIDISHQSRDYHYNKDLKTYFECIDITSNGIVCSFITNTNYRIGYNEDYTEIHWIDPSGGPMISVNNYTLFGKKISKIWEDNNTTKVLFS